MTLQERAEESMKMIRNPKWWIAMIISVIIIECTWEGYKAWCRSYDDKLQQDERERKMKEFRHDLNKEISKGYDFSAGQTSATKPDFPEWSDCNGDYKACRALLLKNLDIINNDSKYRNWAYIVHPEIKGDVLWLYSMHFKEMYIREEVAKDLHQMFIDCRFSKVMVSISRREGQGYWEIWNNK